MLRDGANRTDLPSNVAKMMIKCRKLPLYEDGAGYSKKNNLGRSHDPGP